MCFKALLGKKKDCYLVKIAILFWWGKVDSNHRRHCQQIYSLSPLATREFPLIKFAVELVDGFEPPTC